MKRKITITFYIDDSHYEPNSWRLGDNISFSYDGFYFRNYWDNWTQAYSGLELTLYPTSLEKFKFFIDNKEQDILTPKKLEIK